MADTKAPPITTLADAIADCERSVQRPSGGLCAVSARSLRMVIEAAKRAEAAEAAHG